MTRVMELRKMKARMQRVRKKMKENGLLAHTQFQEPARVAGMFTFHAEVPPIPEGRPIFRPNNPLAARALTARLRQHQFNGE